MRNRTFQLHGVATFALLLLGVPAYSESGTVDASLWSGMRYRMIGPERGGRVTTVTGVPSQPLTFYMGSTGGGVWKTADAGHTWTNVSDGFFSVGSMGAIEVSLSDPNVVYAGTGSSKIRSNVSIGRGIYKSIDAGKTWSFIGLRDTGQIATIRVDPRDADVVYVASIGSPFVPSADRGVFKSIDGGKNWKKVLYLSDELGAADLEIQPGHPEVLFASIWHGQRKPWTIVSGSNDGGIYKSSDAGEHWTKLGGGLPTGLFGRSNVAISAAKPERIYALIEAKPGAGLYRSEDSGATWTLVNGSGNLITRPFYYTTLGVDPTNFDVVWVGDEGWFKSTDGGKTFRSSPVPHGDNHDVWINPKNSNYMIQANDGGANVSVDGGRTWSTQMNQPTAEIYQVAIDDQIPYRVYGAQQDNTTVIAPSLPLPNGQEFRIGPGCETGPVIPDKTDPQIVYGGCKGQFSVQDESTNDEKQYWVGAESLYGNGGGTLVYRFQRVAPMAVSPNEPHTVYYGSQYLHRTRDFGVTWEKISPDLTANPPEGQGASGEPITRDATGEEVYSTLYAIRESPIQKGLIWTGSNDGLVYVTRDDGKTWTNVTPAGLAPGGRVQNIEASPHRPGTAYVAMYRYLLGDFAPYIYRTDDFGKTWTRLTDGTNGIAKDEPTRVVREDPERAGLLYAGTEFGMYISFDNGGHWQPFQMNLPVTPVTDIKLAHGDLVLSTQGRSFWILDNLSPLRQAGNVNRDSAYLFTPRVAMRMPARMGTPGISRSGPTPEYPRVGAMIDYYVGKEDNGDLTVEILDGGGKTVRKFSSAEGAGGDRGNREGEAEPSADDEEGGGFRARFAPVRLEKTPGMHRFTWDLRYPGAWQSATRPEGPNGPVAVPGKYTVKLTYAGQSLQQPLRLVEDPRITNSGVTNADLQEQFEHNMRVRDLVSEVNKTAARVRAIQAKAKSGGAHMDAAQLASLNDIAARLITPPIRYSQPELQTHITYLYTMTNTADQKIGQDAEERYQALRKQLTNIEAELNKVLPGSE